MHQSTQAAPTAASPVPFMAWAGTPADIDADALRSTSRWQTRYHEMRAQQWDHVAATELADLYVTQPRVAS